MEKTAVERKKRGKEMRRYAYHAGDDGQFKICQTAAKDQLSEKAGSYSGRYRRKAKKRRGTSYSSPPLLEYLSQYFRITELYYNPNISDKEEYDKRASELCRLTASMPQKYPVKVVVPPWDPEPFRRISKGLEEEPEGGARCRACFALRLGEAAKMAKDGGFDYFCTTLSISPLKDSQLLNHLGEAIGKEVGDPYLPSDFKKKEGYKRSIALSREYSLYRQDYCGCSFSREERRRQAELQAAERKIQ